MRRQSVADGTGSVERSGDQSCNRRQRAGTSALWRSVFQEEMWQSQRRSYHPGAAIRLSAFSRNTARRRRPRKNAIRVMKTFVVNCWWRYSDRIKRQKRGRVYSMKVIVADALFGAVDQSSRWSRGQVYHCDPAVTSLKKAKICDVPTVPVRKAIKVQPSATGKWRSSGWRAMTESALT